nr:tryptophan halogenase family protein [uncultured Rhodoblastus sp.]
MIVGGGTAGWMAAIYLNRMARPLGCELTLVESAGIGTIGVGEATIPSLVHFLRALNLDEVEFMRRCSATLKLGIRFDDWVEEGITHWHPFGICGARVGGLDLFHFWLKRRLKAGSKFDYFDFSLQVALAEQEKAPWPWQGASVVSQAGSYAYHLDASALADYLRDIATGEGVKHIFGHVRDVGLDAAGGIARLDIGAERVIEGDLFVDATGFAGLLIEKTLGDPWIDWSNSMLCDRAVALPLPRGESFAPFTISKAMPAGWTWRIPLSSRTGNGYVFSSAHCTTDDAIDALIAQSGLRRSRSADPRVIDIRVGRRANFWVKNCVSVGLSSGFVEPLESTGIHLIQKAVMTLADYLPDRNFNAALRNAYNARMAEAFDEVRDFIILHYLLTRRGEPFWRDSRNVEIPRSLRDNLALYDENGRIDAQQMRVFSETSYFLILTGAGRLPRRLITEAERASPGEVWQILDRVRAENRRFVERMPTHANYLAQLHRDRP